MMTTTTIRHRMHLAEASPLIAAVRKTAKIVEIAAIAKAV